MKFIPQYKVIVLYNYDRIIHNIEENNARRQDIGHEDKWKDVFSLKIKKLLIR